MSFRVRTTVHKIPYRNQSSPTRVKFRVNRARCWAYPVFRIVLTSSRSPLCRITHHTSSEYVRHILQSQFQNKEISNQICSKQGTRLFNSHPRQARFSNEKKSETPDVRSHFSEYLHQGHRMQEQNSTANSSSQVKTHLSGERSLHSTPIRPRGKPPRRFPERHTRHTVILDDHCLHRS